jgi:hypothetical protein
MTKARDARAFDQCLLLHCSVDPPPHALCSCGAVASRSKHCPFRYGCIGFRYQPTLLSLSCSETLRAWGHRPMSRSNPTHAWAWWLRAMHTPPASGQHLVREVGRNRR